MSSSPETTEVMDDSVVMVEHPVDDDNNNGPPELTEETQKATETAKAEAEASPTALQIVSIGSEEDAYAFSFHEAKLRTILDRVPVHVPVAVISVVGAFRTGKSFLLSWFLRYLHYLQQTQLKGTTTASAKKDGKPWYKEMDSLGTDGFAWKGGTERKTTGIWMWSHPHLLKDSEGQDLAVLLVDTQGMFDHETTMGLTASIFGFSTLLSSKQIYNVDKRIQEDNLQQLALFSEYARMASVSHHDEEDHQESAEQQKPGKKDYSSSSADEKPFQQIEFLVRDWQHFFDDDDEDHDEDNPNFEVMEKSMMDYLDKVIADRDAKDLSETRQQILACFEKVTCYGLCHPGFAVTKKKYDGKIAVMEDLFLQLIDRYCQRTLNPDNLKPKRVHGRSLTAAEWASYMRAYAELFVEGATFPEASTLLEATASANNVNAVQSAVNTYKETMDHIAGPRCSNYVHPDRLKREHQMVREQSEKVFDKMANFGNAVMIAKAKKKFLENLDKEFDTYEALNEARDPLAGIVIFIAPVVLAFTAMILRWVTDMTCSPYADVCRVTSEGLSHTAAIFAFFLLIVGITRAQQVREVFGQVVETGQKVYTATTAAAAAAGANNSNKAKKD